MIAMVISLAISQEKVYEKILRSLEINIIIEKEYLKKLRLDSSINLILYDIISNQSDYKTKYCSQKKSYLCTHATIYEQNTSDCLKSAL